MKQVSQLLRSPNAACLGRKGKWPFSKASKAPPWPDWYRCYREARARSTASSDTPYLFASERCGPRQQDAGPAALAQHSFAVTALRAHQLPRGCYRRRWFHLRTGRRHSHAGAREWGRDHRYSAALPLSPRIPARCACSRVRWTEGGCCRRRNEVGLQFAVLNAKRALFAVREKNIHIANLVPASSAWQANQSKPKC